MNYELRAPEPGRPCWINPSFAGIYTHTRIKPYKPYLCADIYDRDGKRYIDLLASADGDLLTVPMHDFLFCPCKFHLWQAVKVWSPKMRQHSRPMRIVDYMSHGYLLENGMHCQPNQLTPVEGYADPVPVETTTQTALLL